ncbi:hypothetical protein C8246_24740 [Paracidovorax avenae]|nr:hypothetical protein C8246_24740 [Paracidovorax avenae]
MTTPPRKLRSTEWFGTADKNGFMYRSWMKNQGIPDHEFDVMLPPYSRPRPIRNKASGPPMVPVAPGRPAAA